MITSRHWLALAAVLVGLITFAPVHAATPSGCNNDLACIKIFGDNAVQRRVVDLNNLSNDASLHTNLTANQRSAIEGDAATNSAAVQAFKPQIDGATTPQAARTAITQLQTQLRIYDVVLPRDYLQLYQEQQAYNVAQFTAAEPQITAAIQSAANAGKNVTQAQAQESDLAAKVSDAGTNNTAAAPLFATLTIANVGSGNNDAIFLQIRTHLQSARFDLEAALTDLNQILHEI